jgi:amino acid adenylation domain-containing protein
MGIHADDRVGICVERGFAMVVGLLGILKSGAAYVPLDPTYPADRLAYMLEDSAPAALLSQNNLSYHLSTSAAPVLLLDAAGRMEGPEREWAQDNIDPCRLELTPRHLAYVIYTSGSTGWPKGVMCEHRGLTNLALAQIEAFGIKPASRVLQFASFSFDACVSETVITLCRGATLCLASYEDLMPGEPLLNVLRDERITCATLPPAALAALPVHSELADLECLIVAGETCPPALAARWAQGRRFINAYGPTETTVCATIQAYDNKRPGILPIGRPMANTRIYILDAHRQPVPLGVIGEIFIGGVGVARGYLRREELTAERFLDDPFSATPHARMYRTGDLGRWLPDGVVEYLGRDDTQVKLRGLRIEPGEIESWLRQHHRVKDAVVVAREPVPGDWSRGSGDVPSGDKRLVAYLRLERKVELWPSVSEFYVYDELLYHAMAAHESRNRCYVEAFARHLPGKTVVEIGPGPHAVLARMAIAAGASKVYAIELLERSFRAASDKIRELSLEDKIILIHGDATRVELPERVDYCISEIVGNIGGSEGAAVIINNARRFLKEPAHMIPERSLSRIVAVSLTEDLFEYAFSDTTRHYVERIFASTGGPFDLRVCVRDLPTEAILSTSDVFEDLDYTRTLVPESDHSITLEVEKAGVLTGFMIWMVLYVDSHNVLDTYQDQGSWLPVYFPVFADGVAVAVGDRVVATIARRVSQDLYPDFFIAGAIHRADGCTEPFQGSLPHRSPTYRGSFFYQRLFADETIPVTPQVTPQSLRAHLLKNLPEYMVPSAFITLQEFPLTPNGKLDRRALPAPDQEAALGRDYEPARGETELAVAAIWRELLRLERVGRRDHFFESGGHSLLAVRMLSRVRDVLGVGVSLRELFACPRLDEFAGIVSEALQIDRTPIPPADRSRPLPLSFAQHRLWFLDSLDRAAGAAYHLPAALHLQGPLLLEVLRAALDRIVARHEALRTHFELVGEAPVQVIAPADVGLMLTVEDLSSDPPNAEQLRRLIEAEASKLFDLTTGPLIRGRLLRLGEREHVLLMTQHHIISDGWSIGVLIREVSLLYAALSHHRADPLPPLPVQYADYAAWQRRWLQGEMLHRQVEFWKAQLNGAPALLELPTDRPRPPVQSYVGGAVPLRLSVELSAGLRRLASQQGCTLFMTLLAGWATLLSRLSNQEDVVIGTPVANRQRTQVESLVGLFVNTLPMRVQVRESDTTATLLGQVKARALAAYAHQDLPFEQVVEAVQPPRSLAYSPIFQVGLSLDNTPAEDLRLAGLSLSTIELPGSTTQLDLFLSLRDDGQVIGGELTYVSSLFEATSVARIAGYFTTLMASMVADVQQTVHTLPLLSAIQREQILRGNNRTAVAYPEQRTLPSAFEEQAAIRPNSTALVCKGERLSYEQLNRQANRIAHRLAAMGVRPDQRVAICVERNVGMVVGLLGILKAGAAYVPLDPRYPAERLRYMLDDSAPVALLTEAHLRVQLPQTDVPLVLLDGIAASEPGHNPDPPASELRSSNIAYVIYTSGSTGKPKGVMVEHHCVVNFLASMAEAPGIASDDALLAVTTLSFDIAGLEIFLPLSYGAKLVLAGSDEAADPTWLQKAIVEYDITVMQATPATWCLLLAGGWQGAAGLKALCGGEALPADLSAQLRARVGALWNLYGPTETTIWSACRRVDTDAVTSGPHESIGRPIANTRIHILDSWLQPVPVGVTGEIHIGGAGVARGYLNREDLSAECFIPDPFSADPHARLYKTGDLGRYQPDGVIEYLGRSDFQVKIRGFRIELGEIEARLNECPGVRQSVVTARADRLVAYLLAEEGVELEPPVLRQHLANGLADYMLPSAFVTLREFPLTPNGKIDRRALPAPESDALVMRGHEPPQGEIELAVARIWQDLLGVRNVGRRDRFFELGGHSLLGVQLLSRLRHQLGVELPLRELFTHPSLHDLSILVGESRRSNAPPIATADRSRPLPLSFAQQRLWFLEKLGHAADAAYYMPAALHLVGPLDVDALRESLDRLVARHESLRTTFGMLDGEPVQVIAPAGSHFTLTTSDLRVLPQGERNATARQIAVAEMQAPFDLSVGPLIRAKLLQLDVQEHVLLVTQHHVISDGWSINVLVREVNALYAAVSTGAPDPLPEPRIQYADYAVWQRQWLQGEVLETQTRYWRGQLEGAPALLELPTDRPRPAVQSFVGGTVPLFFSRELSARLRELSQRQGCTLFMTLFAGWSALLSRLSQQDDVVIGAPIANRQRVEVESLIGLFVNTLALRVRFDAGLSVTALLEQVQGTALAAYMHQDLPFEQVVDAVQPPRTLSHSPIYQAGMSVDNVPRSDLLLSNLQISLLQQEQTTTQFDLFLTLSDDGETISGQLEYSDALFDVSTIERWGDHLRTLLTAMAADPSQAVRSLPLLTAEQRHRLLTDFNATKQPYPTGEVLPELFARQALRQPHAIALICEGETLSYDELNRRANRIAHHLIGLGVRPDHRVGICAERSPVMLVGLLGILKAGAAYVPLDPAYPPERLIYMVRDSAPRALLLQAGIDLSLPGTAVPTLLLEANGRCPMLESQSDGDPDLVAVGLTERHLAYLIYTSGSAGQSKGVMIEHRSAINFWRVMGESTHRYCTERARVALNAAFSFDMSLKGILQLLSGYTLILIPQSIRASGSELLEFLARHCVDAFDSTPSQLEGLLAAGLLERDDYAPVSVLLGGEPIKPPMWTRLRQCTRTRFFNMYGPTECTVDATLGQIQELGERASIGRVISNTRVYILDERQEPVPVGVPGEIHIGGVQVARGYWQREALTAERFVHDPFSDEPHARMYKSGDLGRYRADGCIEYLGRNDFQVKIRGFRIEPGEIEAQLQGCAGVRAAVVLAREDNPGDLRLVAYIVADERASPSVEALRQQLGTSLPDYMLPSAFVRLTQLPLTPNGKVDRRALPEPQDRQSRVGRGYEAPRGEVEVAIAQLWRGLLKMEQIGRHDDFFAIGGHSLMGVQLLTRLHKTFGVKVGIRQLFAQPTVAALARIVAASTRAPLPPIELADRTRPLPLSFAQQRLWFLDRLDAAAGAAYHMPAALRLRGWLHRDALQAALNRIVARHEILRTHFAVVGEEPVQVIEPADVGFPLALHDLTHLSDPEAVTRLGEAEAQAPFDLSKGPLIRGQLLRLAERDHVLLITQHHIISDGWSIGLLVEELCSLYVAFSKGRSDPLPAPGLQYADYAMWQRRWLDGEVLQTQIAFWKQLLQGAPVLLALPTTYPRSAMQSYAGRTVAVQLPGALSAGLRKLGQQIGCTLFMTLFAGWASLLARLSGQGDVVVGTPVANRQRPEIESMLGFFANTLALRVQVDEAAAMTELLRQVKHNLLAAYAHQELPFEQVVEVLQPQRSLGHSPVFQVMLNINNTPGSELALPDLELSTLPQEQATTQFDLSLSLVDNGEMIAGELKYARDLFDAAAARRILEQLQVLLSGMVADASRSVGELCAFLPAIPVSAPSDVPVVPSGIRPHYEAPRGRYEIAIAAVWAELLEREPIGRQDDFFALGGVSLMAVRMLSRLRKSYGLQVTLRELFTHPRLAQFARLFDTQADRQRAQTSNLVVVRPSGSNLPLHLVHPVGGEIQYVRELAQWLDVSIPVYGLAATGFAPGETPVRRLPEMAARYIQAIRGVQAEGPYRLAGWSAGGMVAYEMARQLGDDGHDVGFVGLLDTASDYWRRRPADGDGAARWTEANYMLSWLPESLPEKQRQRFEQLAAANDVDAMLRLAMAQHVLPPGLPRELEADMLRTYFGVAYATQEALLNYVPVSIDVPVSLFIAAEETRVDATLGWRQLLGERLVFKATPGTHMTMLESPHIGELSRALSEALTAPTLKSNRWS